MIDRQKREELDRLLAEFPAVALLGPRQVGKTTLALELAKSQTVHYVDLESESGLARLADPRAYLAGFADRLVILDEVQRLPGLFGELRGLIDEGRRIGRGAGRGVGRFLLLGSASIELLRQSSQSLAGRIAYLELAALSAGEVDDTDGLWLRGGFPESHLARSDAASLRWRRNLVRTYLERDIPQLGPRIAAETLRRFWTMLAHNQAGLLNLSSLARGLGVDGKTVANYLDLFVDLLLVRRLEPWSGNVGKRLVKSPKIMIRDSGLVHALLGIESREQLLGHPVAGGSYEGFVIENLLIAAPETARASFYRTAAGAECDLVLELPGQGILAIEVKRSTAPKPRRGFWNAVEDIAADRRILVYPGTERFPLENGAEAVPLPVLMAEIGGCI